MAKKAKKDDVVISYKGFNPDWTCRGFQYEVGKEYKADGKIKCCENGFHACKMPLDVLSYYAPCSDNAELNKFAVVEQSETIELEVDKKVSSKIKILSELSIMDLVKIQIDYVKKNTKNDVEVYCKYSVALDTGDYSVAQNTGNYSVAQNTGWKSVAQNTGWKSVAKNTGDCSVAQNTGDCSVALNTGWKSVALNTGDCSVALNTALNGVVQNTGWKSIAQNTGDCSVAQNTGEYSVAQNTGEYSVAQNTGDYSLAQIEDENSAAFAFGLQSKAKAKNGWIIIVDWREDENYNRHIENIYTAKVGGKILDTEIKSDVWYWFEDGELKSSD